MYLKFQLENFEKLKEKILKNNFKKKTIFNFFNSHDIYINIKIPRNLKRY